VAREAKDKISDGTEVLLPPFQFKLTSREIEIFRLMADGYTNSEISKLLSISLNTVKSHVVHIFNKLDANDRTQASVTAFRYNLI